CPICKMELVRRKKGEAVLLHEGVLARMQFSPYRVQLAGIQTSVVSRRELFQTVRLGGRVTQPVRDQPTVQGDHASTGLVECRATPTVAAQLVANSHTDTAQVSIEVDSIPGSHPGRIQKITNDKGERHGDATVRIEFACDAESDLAGRFAEIQIRIPHKTSSERGADESPPTHNNPRLPLAIPETALVDLGGRQIVYVESMPGMFDALEVVLGPRRGDFYPVESGLDEGQKVATTGVFLIDAEARLNPTVGATYFGSRRNRGPASADTPLSVPSVASKTIRQKAPSLTAALREQARAQKTCPVTDADLDSMGGPVLIEVRGRKLFICCSGCETAVRNEPQKYFAKLPQGK
ncbi:MAG: hypothetical protein NT069_03090, partial [Planctomycetota bacterium]|nr:hypothetical protein [Planctomycetota bacterium]